MNDENNSSVNTNEAKNIEPNTGSNVHENNKQKNSTKFFKRGQHRAEYEVPIRNDAKKSKFSLKKVLIKSGRNIKAHKLASSLIFLAIVVAIGGGVFWYNKTQVKKRVLTQNNQVISEYKNKLPELQKAVSADNKSASAHKNYAIALYVTGNYEAAKNEYETVVKLDGKDSTAYNNLGNTYRDLGQYDKAKAAYEKSFEINPTSINPYVNLANIQLYTQNDSASAISTYRKALKAMPNNNQISLVLGIAYEKAGNTTEAKQIYRDILSRDANDKAAKAALDRLNK